MIDTSSLPGSTHLLILLPGGHHQTSPAWLNEGHSLPPLPVNDSAIMGIAAAQKRASVLHHAPSVAQAQGTKHTSVMEAWRPA